MVELDKFPTETYQLLGLEGFEDYEEWQSKASNASILMEDLRPLNLPFQIGSPRLNRLTEATWPYDKDTSPLVEPAPGSSYTLSFDL